MMEPSGITAVLSRFGQTQSHAAVACDAKPVLAKPAQKSFSFNKLDPLYVIPTRYGAVVESDRV